jgi:predicted permease
VVESVLLALLGGAAALAVARLGGGVLRAVLLPDVAWSTAPVDGRTLGYTALAAIATGLLTGIVPAVQASRPDLTGALKAGAREGHLKRSRTRSTLLVMQAALSVVLLVGAGLFVRSLENVRNLDLGYDPDRVAFATVDLRGTDFTAAERRALHQRMLDRLASMPDVERAGTTLTLPFYMNMDRDLYVPGIDSVGALGTFYLNAVRGDYFGAMGTRIVRGRAIDDRDRAGAANVIVVSETMARVLWPGRDALGQCVKVGAGTPCSTVVGIARDITRGDLRGEAATQYYIAADQMVARRNGAENGLVIRVRGDVGAAKERIRSVLQPLAPGAAYVDVVSLQSFIDPEIRPWRLGATMFGAFGALALLLSAVGLYSVIAYNVAQRTHELGVRVALGARTGDVVRLVLGEGVRVAVVGVTLGLLVALWAGRYVAALLFQISPRDPAVLGVVSVALLAVAVAASLVPAWRASRVDPNLALRSE